MKKIIYTLTVLLCSLTFTVTLSAASIERLAKIERGEIFDMDVTGINFGDSSLYVVAVINSRNNLMIFIFAGVETTPRSTLELGTATSVAVSPLPNKRFITAVRDSDRRLRVIGWQLNENGRTLSRLGTALGPHISNKISAAHTGGPAVGTNVATLNRTHTLK